MSQIEFRRKLTTKTRRKFRQFFLMIVFCSANANGVLNLGKYIEGLNLDYSSDKSDRL